MAATIPLPDPQSKAPFVQAIERLIASGYSVGKVVRVYSAGDELAERDDDGVPRDTVLFLDLDDLPHTGLLTVSGVVDVRLGWG